MSVWECSIVVNVSGLTLGIRVPSDTLNDALPPPSLQVERFEIFQLRVRFSLLVVRDGRAIPVTGGIAMRLIVAHVQLSGHCIPRVVDVFN